MKKSYSKKCILTNIILCLLIVLSSNVVKAEETHDGQEVYTSVLTTNGTEEKDTRNLSYAQYVTNEMNNAEYWKNRSTDANQVLMSTAEIKTLNKKIINTEGTDTYDITKINETKTQAERAKELASAEIPTRDLYINGQKINNETYFSKLKKAILETGYNSNSKIQYYAVAVKRADVKSWPINDIIGYTVDDADDEMQETVLNVNEPFVIRAKCTVDGENFYWGYSSTYSGWVNADKLAICDSKETWIEAWQVDIDAKNFLVVTQDKITLEPSLYIPETSEIKLMLGTTLKLVPENEIPETIGERGAYNNYVVYLPTRDENGNYVKQYALISEHYNVSIGYLPMTQSNILDVAFTCLGNRYGWGGMLGAMDCSLYTKSIYECFGLHLPRNTSKQIKIPEKVTDVSKLTEEEKEKYIEKLPAGSLLYFPGHIMMYLGSENGKKFVISATGSLSDSNGEFNVRSMYSVIINPLTVKRKNENTWLHDITQIISFMQIEDNNAEESKENNNTTNENNTVEKLAQEIYVSKDDEQKNGNVTYFQGISSKMTKALYWKNRLNDANRILMTAQEIRELNQAIVDGKGTNVFDLTKINETKTQKERAKVLASAEIPTRTLYIKGEKIDNQEYFTKLKNAMVETGYNSNSKIQYYAVAVQRADLKSWPTDDIIGYNPTDPDDEMELSVLNVNEPFVIRAKCTVDGETYYWGYGEICSGWVNANKLAICETKEAWIEAWQVDNSAKDFLVVTQDKITLEPSISVPETSEIDLMIGSVLKLVPESEIPSNIGERGTWNNYVVYLPTRDESGKYVKQYALISQHYNVSIGYLPMTQANILDVAFSCLGNRYGWGGMLGAMDCSLYTKYIYKCFGLQLPRNTTWQQNTPGKVTDVSKLTDEEKEKYIEKLPVGSLLYFPGHTMVYVGNENGVSYVISDTGALAESTGELQVKNAYSVILNPLTVRRKNSNTWLKSVSAVLSMNPVSIEEIYDNNNENKEEENNEITENTQENQKAESENKTEETNETNNISNLTNPKTEDKILIFVSIFIISILGIVVVIRKLKK